MKHEWTRAQCVVLCKCEQHEETTRLTDKAKTDKKLQMDWKKAGISTPVWSDDALVSRSSSAVRRLNSPSWLYSTTSSSPFPSPQSRPAGRLPHVIVSGRSRSLTPDRLQQLRSFPLDGSSPIAAPFYRVWWLVCPRGHAQWFCCGYERRLSVSCNGGSMRDDRAPFIVGDVDGRLPFFHCQVFSFSNF